MSLGRAHTGANGPALVSLSECVCVRVCQCSCCSLSDMLAVNGACVGRMCPCVCLRLVAGARVAELLRDALRMRDYVCGWLLHASGNDMFVFRHDEHDGQRRPATTTSTSLKCDATHRECAPTAEMVTRNARNNNYY